MHYIRPISMNRKVLVDDIPTHSETSEELVSQRLGLSHSAQPSELDFLRIELETPFWELESLLDQCFQFTDPSTFVS